jgi:hypothetical protein
MHKTKFDPKTHGFAFLNYWELDQADSEAILQTLNQTVAGVLPALEPLFGSVVILAGLALRLRSSAENANPQTYGLCGGMAFAALDYYTAGIPIPTATVAPTQASAAGTIMRNYLQRRQLDSLRENLGAVLAWMTVLNYIPQWWSFKSGAPWLLDRSKEEWKTLKKNIDAGQPTPLALIGTTKDPLENHQVLAYGYDEPDPGLGVDGTGIIYVYDMNCPGVEPTPDCLGGERTIRLDLREKALLAQECCPSLQRGPLRGFMCEKYSAVMPPIVQDWTTPAPI